MGLAATAATKAAYKPLEHAALRSCITEKAANVRRARRFYNDVVEELRKASPSHTAWAESMAVLWLRLVHEAQAKRVYSMSK